MTKNTKFAVFDPARSKFISPGHFSSELLGASFWYSSRRSALRASQRVPGSVVIMVPEGSLEADRLALLGSIEELRAVCCDIADVLKATNPDA